MPNSASAKKRVRKIATATARNRPLKTKVATLRKNIAAAVESSDKEAAQSAYNLFASAVDTAAKKHIFHKNKAANLKSKAALSIAKIA